MYERSSRESCRDESVSGGGFMEVTWRGDLSRCSPVSSRSGLEGGSFRSPLPLLLLHLLLLCAWVRVFLVVWCGSRGWVSVELFYSIDARVEYVCVCVCCERVLFVFVFLTSVQDLGYVDMSGVVVVVVTCAKGRERLAVCQLRVTYVQVTEYVLDANKTRKKTSILCVTDMDMPSPSMALERTPPPVFIPVWFSLHSISRCGCSLPAYLPAACLQVATSKNGRIRYLIVLNTFFPFSFPSPAVFCCRLPLAVPNLRFALPLLCV